MCSGSAALTWDPESPIVYPVPPFRQRHTQHPLRLHSSSVYISLCILCNHDQTFVQRQYTPNLTVSFHLQFVLHPRTSKVLSPTCRIRLEVWRPFPLLSP